MLRLLDQRFPYVLLPATDPCMQAPAVGIKIDCPFIFELNLIPIIPYYYIQVPVVLLTSIFPFSVGYVK
jgi:hypothetical protein